METNWPAKGIATFWEYAPAMSASGKMETNWPAKGIATSGD